MNTKPVFLMSLLTTMLVLGTMFTTAAQDRVVLTYWTHWGQNPIFNKWYEKAGEEFAKIHPRVAGVQVVDIPYEGYEAKYLSAFMAQRGAPDFFNGMAHDWAGRYDFADPMPADFAAEVEAVIPDHVKSYGVWNGVRYGIPLEGGNFMMMHINTRMFEEAGLDPDNPPQTFDELLEAAKKLTKYDASGRIIRAGYAIRYDGHPVGIADKFLPFLHGFGGRMVAPDWSTAQGYINSPEAVAALTFYGDLVNKHRVASLELGSPDAAFAQGLAAIVFRESWYAGWLAQNAPDLEYKVYPLPNNVGPGAIFAWSNMVYKHSPHKDLAWEFLRFIWTAKKDLEQHAAQGITPVWRVNIENSDFVKSQPNYEAILASLEREPAPAYFHPATNELAYTLGSAIVEVLYGRKDAKTALDQAAREMDRILADY